jgi:hypothetical protein
MKDMPQYREAPKPVVPRNSSSCCQLEQKSRAKEKIHLTPTKETPSMQTSESEGRTEQPWRAGIAHGCFNEPVLQELRAWSNDCWYYCCVVEWTGCWMSIRLKNEEDLCWCLGPGGWTACEDVGLDPDPG